MPGDNGRTDPNRVSKSLRLCNECGSRLVLVNFEQKDGRYADICKSCMREMQTLSAATKAANSESQLKQAVVGIFERMRQDSWDANPDLTRLAQSVIHRLHINAKNHGKAWLGSNPQETTGNLIGDIIFDVVNDNRQSAFLKTKEAKLLIDMHAAILRHAPEKIDFSGCTDADVDAALGPMAIQRLLENDEFRRKIVVELMRTDPQFLSLVMKDVGVTVLSDQRVDDGVAAIGHKDGNGAA